MTAPHFSDFYALPLVGILRGCSSEHLPHILNAVRNGGLRYLEITMNTPDAEDQIRAAIRLSEGSLKIGAGTVTTRKLLDQAIAAGAEFIVTPTFVREVIEYCEDFGLPICPGALTPTEIHAAYDLAPNLIAAVKIFPAELGGPKYIRALRGPFPRIPLMPTGGVDLATLPSFIEAGANAFGIGSPLFRKDRLEVCDWPWLEQQTRAFVQTYQKCTAAKT
jgi:2-dehydro-3-deoxyphosphogluconate aldolase / (4S)-4-hydroxy-2-oxoglutarate aldolase